MDLWYSMLNALPFEWTSYPFMQHAVLAVLLMAPMLALIGCLVISHQMTFFSEAVGHSALTGVAIGAILGLADPTPAVILLAVAMAFAVTALRRLSAASPDTVVGLTMAFAVALGVALLSRQGGFPRYTRYLVGDVLTITPSEIGWFAGLCLVVLTVWGTVYNRMFLTCFDRDLARSRGINPWLHETVFASMVAIVVAVTIPWVGILVINALLLLPAAAARNVAWNNASYHGIALAIAVVSGIAGLAASFRFGTSAGATIVLAAIACFVVTIALRRAGNQ